MLGRRRRRRANIKPLLIQCLVFAGHEVIRAGWLMANIACGGPKLNQQWVQVMCVSVADSKRVSRIWHQWLKKRTRFLTLQTCCIKTVQPIASSLLTDIEGGGGRIMLSKDWYIQNIELETEYVHLRRLSETKSIKTRAHWKIARRH